MIEVTIVMNAGRRGVVFAANDGAEECMMRCIILADS
jgi:hypothetical protein